MVRRLIAACYCLTAAAALAEPAPLSDADLNQTVAGAVIELDTPIGTRIPMRFGRDGLVSGEAGVLATFLGAAKDRGRWWAANDKLCIKWFRWFASEPRCMEIKVDGSRIFWRQDDGDTGTATLRSVPPKRKPAPVVAAMAVPAKPAPTPAPAAAPESAAAPVATPTATAPAAPPEKVAPASETALDNVPATQKASTEPVKIAQATTPPTAAPAHQRPGDQNQHLAAKATASPNMATTNVHLGVSGSFRVARVDEDDMLNVRQGPSEYHEAVGIISPRGRGVVITGACAGEWCPIRHGTITGWVNRYYLVEERKEPGAH